MCLYSENMAGNKIRYTFILLFIFFSLRTIAQEILKAEVRAGDGITILLSRYKLLYSQNLDSFLRLNNLERNDYLQANKTYKLPVYIWKYNGKSIRSTLHIDELQTAEDIRDYNLALEKSGLKKRTYEKDKELWVPMHIFYNPLPGSVQKFKPYTLNFPLFGPKYEDVTIEDNRLQSHVYYLVSGHGGPDPGALGKFGDTRISEDEYAYDVTLRLARNLISHGATVYLITRDPNDGIRDEESLPLDEDEVCYPDQTIPLNQMARLKQRTEIINKLYYENKKKGLTQRTIEIHVDSRMEAKKIDLFFYHYPGSSKSQLLAETMLQTVRDKYAEHQKNREYNGVVKARNLYSVREVLTPLVYIELGNITNDFDQKRLVISNNRQALANWFTEGLMALP